MDSSAKVVSPNGRPGRIVRLIGAVSPQSVQPVIEALLGLNAEGSDPIMLHLSSPGGCVPSGLAVVDILRHIAAPVFIIASGMVASMGAVILVCGEPGYRYALAHSRIMVHSSSGRAVGRLEQVQASVELQREFDTNIEEILLETTKLGRRAVRRMLRGERFLSAREAQTAGIIDHIL